jgi:hypothetical protein
MINIKIQRPAAGLRWAVLDLGKERKERRKVVTGGNHRNGS